MSNGSAKNRKYDLEERTAVFGESVIAFAKTLPKDAITTTLVSQLVRAATSVGANYCEACDAQSNKDFLHKIAISRKESHETKHWLRMVAVAAPQHKQQARKLWQEAQQLTLIFATIGRKAGEKQPPNRK
ncbi:MAG: four helix bundle protein [Planctomycetota bacterium]|nr:MAG: four helix bundle protein [Planctomycetota bacterium]